MALLNDDFDEYLAAGRDTPADLAGDLPDEMLSNLIGESEESAAEADEAGANQEIDIQALAEKIFTLLKREARIENERLGRNRWW